MGVVLLVKYVYFLVEYYGVCVVFYIDYVNWKLVFWVEVLIDYGEVYYKDYGKFFYFIYMLDLFEEDLDDNIGECVCVLKWMVFFDMSIEIELGVIGGEEDGVGFDEVDNDKFYI